MNTERVSAFRILSHREGRVQPMFDAAPLDPYLPHPPCLWSAATSNRQACNRIFLKTSCSIFYASFATAATPALAVTDPVFEGRPSPHSADIEITSHIPQLDSRSNQLIGAGTRNRGSGRVREKLRM